MNMTLKPIGSFVLVEPCAEKEYTEGGLYIPETARNKEGTAVVLAVGDGVEFPDGTKRPLRVQNGQTVLYDKFAGVKTKVDGRDCLFLRENDIYAVMA
jgi:chaperonin GroES